MAAHLNIHLSFNTFYQAVLDSSRLLEFVCSSLAIVFDCESFGNQNNIFRQIRTVSLVIILTILRDTRFIQAHRIIRRSRSKRHKTKMAIRLWFTVTTASCSCKQSRSFEYQSLNKVTGQLFFGLSRHFYDSFVRSFVRRFKVKQSELVTLSNAYLFFQCTMETWAGVKLNAWLARSRAGLLKQNWKMALII